ncbi:MAG: ABC transporter substrate-binding protein [Peptoniphilaceae bacterium]
MKRLLIVIILMLALVGCRENDISKKEDGLLKNESKEIIKIGLIKYTDHISLDAARDGFLEGLEEDGIEIELIEESANGDISLISTIAQKLKSQKVDLIYAISTPAAQGSKRVIDDIPIVFSAVTDPIGAGIVDNLEKPSGNITGVTDYVNPSSQVDEFLKLYPNIKTFGVLYNTSEQNSEIQVEELEKVLSEKNIKLEKMGVNNINDIAQGIEALSNKIDALFALTDNMVANAAPVVSENLLKYKIPSLSAEEGQVKNGLLISQGINYKEQGKQAAKIAIQILNGKEIKDLPVENNKINKKIVNEKTAKALNLDLNNEVFKNAELIK